MSAYALPAALKAEIEKLFANRRRAEAISAQSALSDAYRAGKSSAEAVATDGAALAYAAARLPATYAAVVRVIEELAARHPTFAPQSLLDVGAGPGTATFAALERYATIAALTHVEPNAKMRALATALLAGTLPHGTAPKHVFATLDAAPSADLAIMAYMLVELPTARVWEVVRQILSASTVTVLVEPGTPHGFARINAVREAVRHDPALSILAPCTHANCCPMSADRWCHFNVRLPRTRLHQSIKAADAPFEDERFAYLILSRGEPQQPERKSARMMGDPRVSKPGIALELCGLDGLTTMIVPARDKPRARAAKRLGWGDLINVDSPLVPPDKMGYMSNIDKTS
jgi:ribosomal protein RSM22 (predicted rRNA methylase)